MVSLTTTTTTAWTTMTTVIDEEIDNDDATFSPDPKENDKRDNSRLRVKPYKSNQVPTRHGIYDSIAAEPREWSDILGRLREEHAKMIKMPPLKLQSNKEGNTGDTSCPSDKMDTGLQAPQRPTLQVQDNVSSCDADTNNTATNERLTRELSMADKETASIAAGEMLEPPNAPFADNDDEVRMVCGRGTPTKRWLEAGSLIRVKPSTSMHNDHYTGHSIAMEKTASSASSTSSSSSTSSNSQREYRRHLNDHYNGQCHSPTAMNHCPRQQMNIQQSIDGLLRRCSLGQSDDCDEPVYS
ncbi:hypothetical protein BDF22DRAFT_651898 [Syncephalis plumigaleata]|nr:hypothetical protein BDF22DRAFT_651898 [Syncephalis plumigaleata]